MSKENLEKAAIDLYVAGALSSSALLGIVASLNKEEAPVKPSNHRQYGKLFGRNELTNLVIESLKGGPMSQTQLIEKIAKRKGIERVTQRIYTNIRSGLMWNVQQGRIKREYDEQAFKWIYSLRGG